MTTRFIASALFAVIALGAVGVAQARPYHRPPPHHHHHRPVHHYHHPHPVVRR